jgi:FtsH-binding integral membrane protein
MLTDEEKKFIRYWEENRLRKKKVVRNMAVGLPLGLLFVIAIFANFFSGWYKRADMVVNTDSSLIMVLLVASLLIVVFFSVFSARHRWDINEQRYLELKQREN